MAPYLVLTDGELLQQELVAAAHLENITVLVLEHALALLLGAHVHEARPTTDGLGDHLLRRGAVRDLHRVLLSVAVRRHHPDAYDQLAAHFCEQEKMTLAKQVIDIWNNLIPCQINLDLDNKSLRRYKDKEREREKPRDRESKKRER